MNIIIFGGAFDPIHVGHINIARVASNIYQAKVVFVPSRVSVWKHESVDVKHKLEMLKIAIKNYPDFSIDDFELNTGKEINYSIYTVRYFKKKYPNDKLFLLMGADQAALFDEWQGADEIADLAQIIYYPRDNFEVSIDNINRFHMQIVRGSLYDAASTDIRDLSNLSLDKEVLDYILENNLYFVKTVKSYYTEERYKHAVSVAKLACEIAEANSMLYGNLYSYFFISGYLHDIGKNIPKEIQKQMIEEYCPQYLSMPEFSWHQFTGAIIAQKDFGIEDIFILDAIRYHATGRAYMTNLEKIVFAADKIEPTRGYDSSELIAAMKKDFMTGFVKVLQDNKKYLISKNKIINNQLSDECFKLYLDN